MVAVPVFVIAERAWRTARLVVGEGVIRRAVAVGDRGSPSPHSGGRVERFAVGIACLRGGSQVCGHDCRIGGK